MRGSQGHAHVLAGHGEESEFYSKNRRGTHFKIISERTT